MSGVKERLLGAITVMDENMAARLWDVVLGMTAGAWENIEEEEPDEFDLEMIHAAETDPECRIMTDKNA